MLDGHNKDVTVPVLLLLYEFEAKARLGCADLENILEKALNMTNLDPKAFETIAGEFYYLSLDTHY